MDVKKGSRDGGTSGGGPASKLLSVVSTFVSCLALAGLLVVLVQNQNMQGDVKRMSTQKSPWVPDSAQQEEALREVKIESVIAEWVDVFSVPHNAWVMIQVLYHYIHTVMGWITLYVGLSAL